MRIFLLIVALLLATFVAWYFPSTTPEPMLTLQTIILGLTGIIVYLYTVETQKLRLTAALQTELIHKQLSVSQAALDLAQIQHRRALSPVFKFRTWHVHERKGVMYVGNFGNVISGVSASADGLECEANPPFQIFPHGTEFQVIVRQMPHPERNFEFTLSFRMQDGGLGEEKFVWVPEKGPRPLLDA